ncbi:lactate utilization protein C [Campylobacter sp.]|uniref:LutC/YkgG family protein n=1 Tax=Campylobacter sp. TaxID=205 RepID=UPI002A6596DB|nr:lactate utilization protein C [Campylobacter sp.]MDD7704676.1 lactate utilization protein C [Campylobacteraceae bacterium]MDY2634997.1 lactate utilization protein C [Campylobacter sp.]
MSKTEIFNALKNGAKHETLFSGATPDPKEFIVSADSDIVAEFIARASANKSIIIESSEQRLKDSINEIIAKENAKNLIYPQNLASLASKLEIESKIAFDNDIESFKERIFDYDISVINARGGVSSHGVTCVSSAQAPRLLSLAPKICVVILKRENIVKSLSEQLNKIKAEDGRLPTNVVFISGPSRTSDIELQLVLGVHGSQIFYVVLV